jgi:hypothetical protein
MIHPDKVRNLHSGNDALTEENAQFPVHARPGFCANKWVYAKGAVL